MQFQAPRADSLAVLSDGGLVGVPLEPGAMSWVANVMVSVDADDNVNVQALSEWLSTEAPRRYETDGRGVGSLRLLTSVENNEWGGWKMPECEVWAGALNHADLNALRQQFLSTPWREPNAAQLMVMDQEESFFRLWMIRGGELRQFAPLEPKEEDAGFYRGDVRPPPPF